MEKELIKSLLPTLQIEFQNDSFRFKKGGKYHWVYMRPWDGKFEATRNGRDFQDNEAFDTLEEAIEWIKKIFEYL